MRNTAHHRVALLAVALLAVSGTVQAQSDPREPVFFDPAARAANRAALGQDPAVVLLRSRALRLDQDPGELQWRGDRLGLVQLVEGGGGEAELSAAGVLLTHPLGGRTYLARVADLADWTQVARRARVGVLYPEDRLSESLYRREPPPGAIGSDGRWQVRILPVTEEDVPALQDFLLVAGGGPAAEGWRSGRTLRACIPPAILLALAGREDVAWVEPGGHVRQVVNLEAQAIDEVDVIQAPPRSLDGSGVAVGVWDEGRSSNHADYSGRRVNVDGGAFSSHSTHVTGTIIGNGSGNPAAEGMAPAGMVYNYNWDGDLPLEMSSAVTSYGIVASSNSWGYVVGWYWTMFGWADYGNSSLFGDYITESADWDGVALGSDLIVNFAAGNDRGEGPGYPDVDGTLMADGELYDCLDPNACAKNVITVGALSDDGITMTSFSGFGTTDDGRVKPDVVANGESLLSTVQGGYDSFSGTSMATPVVSGVVADLVQYYRSRAGGADPSAALLKAILCHTAVDLHLPGPDARTGFGKVSGRRAVDAIEREFDPVLQAFWEGNVDNGTSRTLTFDVPAHTGRLVATLVWMDQAGNPASATALVNDLDLTLEGPGGIPVVRPFLLSAASPHLQATRGVNSVDTVEQVSVDSPAAGTWTARVAGTSVTGGAQDFAVVTEGNLSPGPEVRRIEGQVTECGVPAPGVEMRLTGTVSQDGWTDSSGYYVFQVSDGSYTVAPTSSTATFSPVSRAVVVSGASVSGQDFALVPGAGGGPVQGYLVTPGLAIPDNNPTGITSTRVVADSFSILELDLRVQITHTYRGDLRLVLTSPAGTSATLRVPDGGESSPNLITEYDTLTAPVDSLSVFVNEGSAGTWSLQVSDEFAQDTGTLDEWELKLRRPASPPDITTASLPAGTEGTAYSETLAATSGTPPYSWSVVAGSLPAGLSLNAGTGELSGIPSVAGSSAFTVRVDDSLGLCDSVDLTLTINPSGPVASGVCGDCDNSGSVSILDALLAAQSDAGIASVDPLAMGQCNVAGAPGNGPGSVSVIDALLIARYVVGLTILTCVP